jgi:hypothetical protein
MNDQSAVPATRVPEIVLRRLHWVVYDAVLAAVLISLFFEIPMTHGTLKGMAGAGAVGALIGGIMTAGFRCRIGPGMLTVTELYMRQSVDLNRLTSVSAPDRPEPCWFAMLSGRRRWLELRDERGPVVRLNFFGIWRAPRQRLLAALEPYAMADGVSRTGLVTEALSGQLWWPRPRPS